MEKYRWRVFGIILAFRFFLLYCFFGCIRKNTNLHIRSQSRNTVGNATHHGQKRFLARGYNGSGVTEGTVSH